MSKENARGIRDELISRQVTIDALERAKQNIRHNIERAIGDAICEILDEVENGVKQLPPIQPKRGRWKNIVESIEYACGTCDACGARISMAYKYYEYCPRCGAKMKVTE